MQTSPMQAARQFNFSRQMQPIVVAGRPWFTNGAWPLVTEEIRERVRSGEVGVALSVVERVRGRCQARKGVQVVASDCR